MTERLAERCFRLFVEPHDGDAFGLRLEERNGRVDAPPYVVVRASPKVVGRVSATVLDALRASDQPRSALHARRVKPIELHAAAAVRLALVLTGIAPLRKTRRVEAVERGVAAMSTEEAYYWYARCMGADAPRARRALRLLLASE